ncbi:spore cortex protein YabQ [Clostridium acetireducens DSM 10703]|jgi:spore cortex biosynthesis protein YabQ|uniref:Spore cortex protein YabQ n=1 Tax=Clostridium acetireducens DSM 10703 TaxID=1121290 RepID=A0A1E8EZL1_9CLOT|nr:spore cortex biosynthesis protein YabQ [Clostridium acetireducens]OFI06568.1 spore cortex protein YabQ [Clostridium acetireducens DSM 10703]
MVISISQQLKLVIFSIIAGQITGMLFDLYRLIRGFKVDNKLVTFIEDTLFWIFSAILVFVFLLFTNYAYIGLYVYFCIAIGIIIYLKFISKTFLRIQYKFLKNLMKFFRILVNILLYPLESLIYKIRNKKNL